MKVGLKYTSETIVSENNTAIAVGSGDLPVFSTPSMIALMENASMALVSSCLAEGDTTVGANVNVSHLVPSKIGSSIQATAELILIEGRKLTFDVKAEQDGMVIGKGTHVRYIVNREKFMK
jgi:predicted thioesterase